LRNRQKTEMISLSYSIMTNDHVYCLLKVKICLTSYGFSQYRSYTDLNGYWLGLLTNCEVKKILSWNKHGH